jgi:hypothetical protein
LISLWILQNIAYQGGISHAAPQIIVARSRSGTPCLTEELTGYNAMWAFGLLGHEIVRHSLTYDLMHFMHPTNHTPKLGPMAEFFADGSLARFYAK